MGLNKAISEAFPICSSVSISNAQVFVSSASSVKYRDTITYQFVWARQSSTTFGIQVSSNYSPGLPQNPGQANSGNWDDLTLSPTPTSYNSTSYTVNLNQIGSPWVRFIATTTSSGTALLTATVTAKSLG